MKLIGARSLIAAPLVCATIALIVAGVVLAATIAQVLAGKLQRTYAIRSSTMINCGKWLTTHCVLARVAIAQSSP
jgi:hypothetical protein